MDIFSLIIGLFMIGMGFLIKSTPDLIAGYNTMSKEKKKNVDIEGLSTFMRNSFIAIGLTIIIGYYLFKWIGLIVIAHLMIPIAIFGGVAIILIGTRKFDHNENKGTKLAYFISGLTFILIFIVVIWSSTDGLIPSKVTYSNDTINFSGKYGFELNAAEIESVELSDTIPTIRLRTNG